MRFVCNMKSRASRKMRDIHELYADDKFRFAKSKKSGIMTHHELRLKVETATLLGQSFILHSC